MYLDPDGKDFFALHLLGLKQESLIAYARLFPPSDVQSHIVFGRVLTATTARGKGYGKKLLRELLSYCDKHYPGIKICCSAQNHLRHFYEEFGFTAYGKVFIEAGIPHIAMQSDFSLSRQ